MAVAARRDNRLGSTRLGENGDGGDAGGGKDEERAEASLSPRSGDQQAGQPECRVVQPGSMKAAASGESTASRRQREKKKKKPCRRVRLRLGGLGGDKIRDGTDGFSGSIACPLAATGVIRCVELFVDAERQSREEGKREKKAKKAKEEELVRYDSRRGWGNKVTRWST